MGINIWPVAQWNTIFSRGGGGWGGGVGWMGGFFYLIWFDFFFFLIVAGLIKLLKTSVREEEGKGFCIPRFS